MKTSPADVPGLHGRRLRVLQRQIARLDRCLLQLGEASSRLSHWRLLTFLALLVGGAAVLLSWGLTAWVLFSLILLLIFAYWVVRHRRVEQTAVRVRLWRMLKQAQVARMTLDWPAIPPSEAIPSGFEHPFALDLDMIGERSLQRLLDLAVTKEGSGLLRRWLLEFEPDLAELPRRQELVEELQRLPALANRLTLNALQAAGEDGREMPARWSSIRLVEWLKVTADAPYLRPVSIILLLLVPLNVLLFLAFAQDLLPPYFLLSWFLYGALTISQMRHVRPMFADTAAISDGLRQMEAVFAVLEERSFARFPALAALTEPLRTTGSRPADLLARTNRLLAAAGLRYNPFVSFLINALFPLDILVALRLSALKETLAALLPNWLSVWHELEALTSLANFAYLYPQAVTADIFAAATVPFSAQHVGHPLIPEEDRVYNDFVINSLGDLVLVTGSNMAGKSTFLRTVGMNIRLALCGAPVLAASLQTIPLRVFASITIADSLTDGFSFFYAEVRRLQALLEALREPEAVPLFFLIDEIFRGTNNRERLIGSRSYVQALLDENGCGAIATHDLELVSLAQGNSAVSNYHFRDDVVDGRMVFDYTLRPGPCPTTNALRIMRLAGLPVTVVDDSD